MSSYTFRWPHPEAEDVHVTGNFDNWAQTTPLDKVGTGFEKTLNLPYTEDKILYKFVVDGRWIHDHTAPTETDHEGNVNNVIYAHDLGPPLSATHHISSVGPGASTLAMAGEKPTPAVEKDTPGAFPVTPGPEENQTFSVNPIPKSDGIGNPVTLAPGESVPEPSSLHDNTISSTVHDDPELKSAAQEDILSFGVAPLPAFGGIGNPITLAPGAPVPDPSTITGHTTESNVRLDQASYEKSDGVLPVLPAGGASAAADSTSGDAGVALLGGLGPQTSSFIPESSMGMGSDAKIDASPLISSVGPTSTTATLAGQVPLEPKGVPTVVSESQREADVAPEAAANPTAVLEKKEVEQELQSKIEEAPVTSDETHKEGGSGDIKAAVIGGAAAAGAAVIGAAAVAREKITEQTGKDPVSVLPESVQNKINDINAESDAQTSQGATSAVPAEVKESQLAAHASPEASANPEAVHEKALVEDELKSKVPEVDTAGTPAPTLAAATSATAPTETTTSSGAPQLAPVSGLSPITIGNSGLNASAASPALPPATQAARLAVGSADSALSRDVSPMTKPSTAGQTEPVVTTGVATSTAPAQSTPTTPRTTNKDPTRRFSLRGTPDSSKTTKTDKSDKHKGFLSRLKEKLKK